MERYIAMKDNLMNLAISAVLVTAILAAGSATAEAKTPSGPEAVTPAVNRVVAGQVSKQIADTLAQGQQSTRAGVNSDGGRP